MPRRREQLPTSCLENSIDRGAWQSTVQMVAKRVWHDWETFTRTHVCVYIYIYIIFFLFQKSFLINYIYSTMTLKQSFRLSVLAWRIPGTKEPSRLPSMGSHRVGHDWSDLAAAAADLVNLFCLFCITLSYGCIFPEVCLQGLKKDTILESLNLNCWSFDWNLETGVWKVISVLPLTCCVTGQIS